MAKVYKQPSLGILGGGQLGRMLIPPCLSLNVKTKILDPDPHAPCANLTSDFVNGSLTDYQTVVDFGKGLEYLTIEIEKVNTDALETLQKEGVKVYPQPQVIKIIQDKRLQKQFYKEHGIPTSEFVLTEDRKDVFNHKEKLPFVHKLGRDGYDGKGVQVIRTEDDLEKAFEAPGVLEELVDIEKEISVIVARNEEGQTIAFPAVELVYHEQNLVDYLIGPADISEEMEKKAEELACKVTEKFGLIGILAIEMFITKSGEVLVNEVAPRPHNSGHQTIEANITSQYEQLVRAVIGLPLGDTSIRSQSAMLNLLGSEGHNGIAVYEGLDDTLDMKGVYIHLYGKKITKPHRKMGHITIIGDDRKELIEKIEIIKKKLKIVAD